MIFISLSYISYLDGSYLSLSYTSIRYWVFKDASYHCRISVIYQSSNRYVYTYIYIWFSQTTKPNTWYLILWRNEQKISKVCHETVHVSKSCQISGQKMNKDFINKGRWLPLETTSGQIWIGIETSSCEVRTSQQYWLFSTPSALLWGPAWLSQFSI